MDNITHSLTGWALAETGLKRRTRKGLAACVLAANMPDIDVFFGWAPWAPLAMHRGFTHGLVGGVLVMPPLLAGLLWLLDRWQVKRGATFASGLEMRPWWLLALCYLGALTHPLLDLQNTYAVQLLSPTSTRWFHTDGLFIVSPWLLAMLGGGIFLAWRKAKAGAAFPGKAAVAGLAGVVLFIGANIGISQMAGAALRKAPPHAHPDRVFASPGPLAFWQREVVWRENGALGYARYDPLADPGALSEVQAPEPDNMARPEVRRAIEASAELRDFLEWSQMPFARISREGCTETVTVGDGRYARGGFADGFRVEVALPVSEGRCSGR
ncbi:metal-dependent hydrolase [Novosphingobium mangrovi (ex Hu et al. 2023)]|uniref:Metal-dependent hydrolase n=1 Tax=Novosphingobium mangrovi (ex Hu et al. 2023) TaxID=2930094 RepID=A0ABT0A8I5_9SPHN|nr:metal-dependent hydrolase [Novosphingobium mangrovi (ex Hu et al. 2023)]MCJ1959497.1 metal-dependent hydrolase [Novosphingobium mangrovi (ex Hu et al. 2023)]